MIISLNIANVLDSQQYFRGWKLPKNWRLSQTRVSEHKELDLTATRDLDNAKGWTPQEITN